MSFLLANLIGMGGILITIFCSYGLNKKSNYDLSSTDLTEILVDYKKISQKLRKSKKSNGY